MGEKGMKCVICGAEFTPKKKKQVTCLSDECRHEQHLIYMRQYANRNRDIKGVSKQEYKREKARQYRARKRGEVYVPNFESRKPKEKPMADASTYAERQRAKTLAMVGKVEV